MTSKNKLKFVIEGLVERGWGIHYDIEKICVWDETFEAWTGIYSPADILFSHPVAKLVFGEGEKQTGSHYGEEIVWYEDRDYRNYDVRPYLHHLAQVAQLETDEERVDYYYRYMSRKAGSRSARKGE